MVEKKEEEFSTKYYIINFFCILFIVILIYQDMFYKRLSMRNWLTKVIPNNVLNYMLRILGAYGLIQVFAQDIGKRTGNVQKYITHHPFIQFVLYWATAYSLTDDRSEALMGSIIYFYMRHILSNKTLKVCFEEV